MLALVAIWSVAEASLFFIVADVPIGWIGLRWGVRPALRAAPLAAPMAALGGVGLAMASSAAPEAAHRLLLHIPGVSEGSIAAAQQEWHSRGVTAMLVGAFTGVPYKLYAYAAALDRLDLFVLFGLSLAARLPRFMLVAAISSRAGAWLRPRLSWARIRALYVCFWVVFYAAYFWAR